jgi:hypothetical protein
MPICDSSHEITLTVIVSPAIAPCHNPEKNPKGSLIVSGA